MNGFANRNRFLVALGANRSESIGQNATSIEAALALIARTCGVVRAASRLWQTPAHPPGAGPDFVNACALVESDRTAAAFLAEMHRIEAAMGRVRLERWGARVIDLDLVACGDLVLPDRATFAHWLDLPAEDQRRLAPGTLILPHPRMHERAFVLIPLLEVAPDWVHPVLGRSVSEMADALPPAAREGLRLL